SCARRAPDRRIAARCDSLRERGRGPETSEGHQHQRPSRLAARVGVRHVNAYILWVISSISFDYLKSGHQKLSPMKASIFRICLTAVGRPKNGDVSVPL